ncbi:ergothioneine biosynthesis protein EgtB [Ramlibacter monticola]|uniref:SUMF1/EgtB/PvdO family nonheme iron enzyme n=1 Tax=Ramlibacter monticola TaxID=1926872 RepID=A0A936YWU2_9BURK|nr:selenoneine synthase SenA [Ramlibacter monticola]MBL0390920.1 SUMF1/EgtB/PvdO family nonheme iron enzyme [Ramlibacter monticola]
MRIEASTGYSAAAPTEALALRQGPPSAVRSALRAARQRTLQLAEDFRQALGPAPHVPYAPELNPPLWEMGHVAWFQEWWITRNPQRHLGVHADPGAHRLPSRVPQADACYDSSRVGHRVRWELPLPDADATGDYLARTLEHTLQLLGALDGADDDRLYFFRLAAVHEQMHAEAAVYMAQALGIPLRECQEPPRVEHLAELPVGPLRFGIGVSCAGFAFDNELPAYEVELPRFEIDSSPVSWGAFLPFLEAGGYEDPQWWTEPGRTWLASLRERRPAGVRRVADHWEQMRHGSWRRLRAQEVAVHLSAHEADAWCRWAGRRLPTEAEWECAALTQPRFRWGQAWEWTASPFAPYPGFVPHPYRDYSQPWFGTRRVLRGASPATAPALAHARYRNFFEPHRRDVLAGFRSVHGARVPPCPTG